MVIEFPDIPNMSDQDQQTAADLVASLYHRYAHNLGPTSLPYWLDRFSSLRQGTRITMALAEEGLITTRVPKSNWAEVSLNEDFMTTRYTREELDELRRSTLLHKYKPTTSSPSSPIAGACQVKLASGITTTGLVRLGFASCSHHKFTYDKAFITKYYSEIEANAIKAMKLMEAKLGYSLVIEAGYDYESVIKAVLQHVLSTNDEYTLGSLTLDSRGRAIYDCVRKVFNPIANKFARSLVVMPAYTIKPSDLDNAFLFIAELVSGFDGDIDRKLANGKLYYSEKRLPNVSGDDLFERIWIERIYAELDAYFQNNDHQFTTPIELDFSSSNMVMIGLLLGYTDYVDHTQYMWQVDGLSKLHVKKAQTPYVFGSTAPITKLWKKADLDFTADQVLLMKHEQTNGKFAIANELKDIIINHCTPQPKMVLHIRNEKFLVECNRYKYVGDTTKQYVVYDSVDKGMKVITHTSTHKMPDLAQFKRYFVTGLIHNIDSQIMDNVVKKLSWVIPIHDAGLVSIAEATLMRELAVIEMEKLAEDGITTLYNYFKSIGLTPEGYERFAKLLGKVKHLNNGRTLNITKWLLK